MTESINGEAVDRISDLAQSAAGLELNNVTVNGAGLPSSFPIAFDKRKGGAGLIGLRSEAERWRTFPERRKGIARVSTLLSFIELVNRHKEKEGDTVIFAETQWPTPKLTSVLNYHQKQGEPRFGDHRVEYAFPLTDEFKAWAEQDGQPMSQSDFAAFIEEHIFELANATEEEAKTFEALFRTKFATPTDLITLSRGLQVHVQGVVKNAITLQSGEQQVTFVEEHVNDKGEPITVPGLFMVSLPAFIGGEVVRFPTRLRYRQSGGKLVWAFQMFQWKKILRDRVIDDLGHATEQTGCDGYEGHPEA